MTDQRRPLSGDGVSRETRALLQRLPKAELHCHLDGSLRPSTMLALAAEHGVPLPHDDEASLRTFMTVSDAHNLEEYLSRFETTLAVMQTESAIERIAYELVEDAARDGVRYIEVRFAPQLNTKNGLSREQVLAAALRGLGRGEREHGTIARAIVCALRHQPPTVAMELAELAVAHRTAGVVGFDLAGAEAGNPATRYAEAFAIAHRHDLACTCHAGEGAGAESVRDALHGCCPDRLGHATRLGEDAALLDDVIERRIPLEICLTSNVQTHAASSYELHPFRSYFDRGCVVVLNTDNRLMSATTLSDEYVHAADRLGFSVEDLARVAMASFECAFLPNDERRALIQRVDAEMRALGVRVS